MLGLSSFCLAGTASPAQPAASRTIPEISGRFDNPAIGESSGLAASKRYPGVFWTVNDSGDSARIFAVHADGSSVEGPGAKDGIRIEGATNVDWEALALAGERLYIADVGNNRNERRDLKVYVVPEPNPATATRAPVLETLSLSYLPQTEFPPLERNFDAEALFFADAPYLLTKHRSDSLTTLYAVREAAKPLESFEIGGMVTGAAYRKGFLAVLTYHAVWLFERAPDGAFLGGRVWNRLILAGQCEAICFESDEALLLSNEQGTLYRVPLETLREVVPSVTTP